MRKIRTIAAVTAELRNRDPETDVTEYFLRQKVISGEIPSIKAGKKYLVDLDDVLQYFDDVLSGSHEP